VNVFGVNNKFPWDAIHENIGLIAGFLSVKSYLYKPWNFDVVVVNL